MSASHNPFPTRMADMKELEVSHLLAVCRCCCTFFAESDLVIATRFAILRNRLVDQLPSPTKLLPGILYEERGARMYDQRMPRVANLNMDEAIRPKKLTALRMYEIVSCLQYSILQRLHIS